MLYLLHKHFMIDKLPYCGLACSPSSTHPLLWIRKFNQPGGGAPFPSTSDVGGCMITRHAAVADRGGFVNSRTYVRLPLPPSIGTLFLLLALIASMHFSMRATAQTSYGSITGTVTDQSGAAVQGAKVTLESAGTGARQETVTGGGGVYNFPNLNPGSYSVTASHGGFQTTTQSQIDVQIGGSTRVDVALQVGNVDQSVTVTASSATSLQTDSASLGGVIEGQQIVEAPLNGRNVNNLLDFVPGVIPGGGTQGSTMANGGSGNFQAGGQTQAIAYGNYQIGGAFSGQSLFFIDGVESNVLENNVNSLVLTQDAVQEFRVS